MANPLRHFSVALLPSLADPAAVAGADVVVTDVLRASTTMIAALVQGAEQVLPVPAIPDGLACKSRIGDRAVLGGERKGVIIPGYDRGNSPREFGPAVIGGRTLILCTTNGTVAVESARGARRILIGALTNLSAVAAKLADSPRVTVICAGTDRQISSEDVLFAGALAQSLGLGPDSPGLDDPARLAAAWWTGASARMASGQTTLEQLLRESRGGRNLVALGYDADIQYCAKVDLHDGVPELDQQSWSIRLVRQAAGTAGS